MPLTKDEALVLRHLALGRTTEEIAATLNWPLEAVRSACTYLLITWVLDELDANTTPADSFLRGTDVRRGPRWAFVPPNHSDEYQPERGIPLQLPAPPPRNRTGVKDAALRAVGYVVRLISAAIGFLVMVVVGGAIVLVFAHALRFFWRILTNG